jgi:catechol 2,3-dioxygenase-like lactoylglutathione lyase family enzyme
MIRHLAGFGEVVDDVDATVAFYRDVLGLEVEHEEGSPYAEVKLPGIPHFGLWGRAHAAEVIFGDASAADRLPIGPLLGFEVDDVVESAAAVEAAGGTVIQQPTEQPWGQKVSRFLMPDGRIAEISETPWARELPTVAG